MATAARAHGNGFAMGVRGSARCAMRRGSLRHDRWPHYRFCDPRRPARDRSPRRPTAAPMASGCCRFIAVWKAVELLAMTTLNCFCWLPMAHPPARFLMCRRVWAVCMVRWYRAVTVAVCCNFSVLAWQIGSTGHLAPWMDRSGQLPSQRRFLTTTVRFRSVALLVAALR